MTRDDALTEITHHFADQPPASLRSVALAPIATCVRSLARGPDATWLVLARGGTWLVDLDGPRLRDLGFAAPLAAATDPEGTVLLAGEQRRLATWASGELVDVPPPVEQIIACAALGRGRFVCAGERHLFAFDVATRELEVLHVPSKKGEDTFAGVAAPYLAVTPDGSRIAWCRSARTIQIGSVGEDHLEPVDSVAYPSIYSGTEDVSLSVRGIAFLDRDHLAIALDHGRCNIIDLAAKSAVRLDPLVDDPPARWIFIFAGRTLIAD